MKSRAELAFVCVDKKRKKRVNQKIVVCNITGRIIIITTLAIVDLLIVVI
jgi:hypothetical protein